MAESGPCFDSNFTAHLRPTYPHENNSSQIGPTPKPCTTVRPPFQPPSAFSSKQTRDGNSYNLQSDSPHQSQKFYGLSHYAPTPSITTIQQLGVGITHAFSTLIINSFKKLVHSQTSPAFDHYDFLLPRDQIVGLLLDNSLDEKCKIDTQTLSLLGQTNSDVCPKRLRGYFRKNRYDFYVGIQSLNGQLIIGYLLRLLGRE